MFRWQVHLPPRAQGSEETIGAALREYDGLGSRGKPAGFNRTVLPRSLRLPCARVLKTKFRVARFFVTTS